MKIRNEQTLGEKIKNLIKEKGYTVTEFAQKVNCSRRTLYEIFKKDSIEVDLLMRISKVLNYNFFNELNNEYQKEIGKEVVSNQTPYLSFSFFQQKKEEPKESDLETPEDEVTINSIYELQRKTLFGISKINKKLDQISQTLERIEKKGKHQK